MIVLFDEAPSIVPDFQPGQTPRERLYVARHEMGEAARAAAAAMSKFAKAARNLDLDE